MLCAPVDCNAIKVTVLPPYNISTNIRNHGLIVKYEDRTLHENVCTTDHTMKPIVPPRQIWTHVRVRICCALQREAPLRLSAQLAVTAKPPSMPSCCSEAGVELTSTQHTEIRTASLDTSADRPGSCLPEADQSIMGWSPCHAHRSPRKKTSPEARLLRGEWASELRGAGTEGPPKAALATAATLLSQCWGAHKRQEAAQFLAMA